MTLNFDYHDIKWINNEVYALLSGCSREELNRISMKKEIFLGA